MCECGYTWLTPGYASKEVLRWGNQDSEEAAEVTPTLGTVPWMQEWVGESQGADRWPLAPQAGVWGLWA